MTSITRYVLLEVLKVFLVTLAGMTLIMIVAGALHEAVRQGLGVSPILRLIPYVLPNALRFAVPGTILFSACLVYGRMAAANEVIAIKSLGVSPLVLLWPTLILAFFISLVGVWLNDLAVSWGRQGIKRVVLQSLEQIAYGMLRTQRSYANDRFSITVMDVADRKLVRPTITFFGSGENSTLMLRAEEGELRFNPDASTLNVEMLEARVVIGKDFTLTSPGVLRQEIQLTLGDDDQTSMTPSHCPLRRIPLEINEQEEEIERQEQALAAETAFELLSGDFSAFATTDHGRKIDQLRKSRERSFRLQTEPWRRWANGFSCLFFVLVGAPLAVRLKTADFWTSFGLCFLPILFVYYPLLAFGVDRAKAGELPPYCVWLGNLVLCLGGIWLARRVHRY